MLFTIKDLQFGFEDNVILDNLSITFDDGDRIGFIGKNGAGKTTLLRLILGELIPEKGEIIRKNDLSLGYLKQNADFDGDKSVYQTMLDAFVNVLEAEKKMREIEVQLQELDTNSLEYTILANKHRDLDNYYNAKEGYDIDRKIKKVLNGMGFMNDYEKPVHVMSGGERTRLALAKLLLTDVDLLILDEPTNHLDVATMAWLEKYLQEEYKGCLLIVSHDRYFLDKTVNKIWELENLKVKEWRGNYSKYKQLKEEYVYAWQREYDKQHEQIEAMLDYARRNIVRATTSKSAKSRLKRIDNLDIIDKPTPPEKPPVFIFTQNYEANKDVLTVTDLELKVGNITLCDLLSFEVKVGERMAIVGANGVGKSTLIKTLLGMINTTTDHYNPVPNLGSSGEVSGLPRERHCNGAIKYGKNLSISYYDQENINLTPYNTVLEELWYRFPSITQTTARSILAKMLFTAEDMDKLVSSLSGGERAKLAFAIVIAEKSNLLIFDEPTNHLDLLSREALEKGINEFEGTIIYVSHDRYFMNATATSILELQKSGARVFKGSYDRYLSTVEKELAAIRNKIEEQKVKAIAEEKPMPKAENKSFRTKEDRRKEAKRVERIREIEKLITQKEELIQELNNQIYNGKEYEKMKDIYKQIENEQSLLEELYNEWETLSE